MADDIPSIASAVVLPEPADLPPTPASPPNGLKRRQSSFSEQDGKRRRLSTEDDPPARRESIPDRAAETRRSGQGNVAAVERKRGQRLLGAMLGALSQNSSSTSQRRRADIEKKQAAKLKLQEQEFDQRKQERLDRLVAMRKKEQKRFDEESMRIRHSNLLNMAQFLYTRTEPRLYYKPWEITPAEEDQINTQVDEAQAIVDQELDDFRRRREEKEGVGPFDRVDAETVRPVGSVPSGDVQENLSTSGTTDHSAAIRVIDDSEHDNGEKAKEEEAVTRDGAANDQETNSKPGTAKDTSKETIDDAGDVVLEATEDTVIY
ncbi:pinin/SDK/memA domain-containing protein [Mytilinidion resinicola]|uniref:Pinin/SDK/memA domain-containing protein n=1 Tax=Mytilinidion resinicola TaxID=574789 RepID=A0A6A6YBJ6_9PEZI|nr:pinin/SDK/memA domain-containing protein [Mytilinidion resinicola]KAF2806182.1 pinin/SDK/memA domain-containing protein [Mytilinidion resinicola]